MTEYRPITLGEWQLQVSVWGCAVSGHIDVAVATTERWFGWEDPSVRWDDPTLLTRTLVGHGNEPYRSPKDWAALPWMTEHIMRGHVPYPGL